MVSVALPLLSAAGILSPLLTAAGTVSPLNFLQVVPILAGITVEITRDVCRILTCCVKFYIASENPHHWESEDAALRAIGAGMTIGTTHWADAAGGAIIISSERTQIAHFTTPYLQTGFRMVTRRPGKEINLSVPPAPSSSPYPSSTPYPSLSHTHTFNLTPSPSTFPSPSPTPSPTPSLARALRLQQAEAHVLTFFFSCKASILLKRY